MRTVLVLTLAVVSSLAAPQLSAATDVRLKGRYRWDVGGAEGPLEARFTPEAGGTWRVSFSFRFDGRDHQYEGTASGNPEQGEVSGEVNRGTGGRTFTFKGTSRAGRFTGTHGERERGGRETTLGTLTLER